MQAALDEWRHGRSGSTAGTDSVGRARASSARLHGVPRADVAIGPQVSMFVGSSPRRCRPARAWCAAEDFTSLLFPLLAQEARGVTVGSCRSTGSPTRSTPDRAGRVQRGPVLATARSPTSTRSPPPPRHHGARTFVDATQACGWLPFDAVALRLPGLRAATSGCSSPRGTAFFDVARRRRSRCAAAAAGWYAARRRRWRTSTARRCAWRPTRAAFDISPAWLSWVGAGAGARAARAGRDRGDPPHDVALAAASARASAWSRRLGDRLARPPRGRPDRLAARARALRRAAADCALLVPPLTPPRRTSTAALDAALAGRENGCTGDAVGGLGACPARRRRRARCAARGRRAATATRAIEQLSEWCSPPPGSA